MGTGALVEPSAGYFIALGMIVNDKYLRPMIQQGIFSLDHGPAMSASEKANILGLAGNSEIGSLSAAFCKAPWDGSNCNSTSALWDGRLHPIAVSVPY